MKVELIRKIRAQISEDTPNLAEVQLNAEEYVEALLEALDEAGNALVGINKAPVSTKDSKVAYDFLTALGRSRVSIYEDEEDL